MRAATTNEAYRARRDELERYFDRTAIDAWIALTADAKVSRIRATVRAGREEMRRTLLSWLPADLTGRRVLDAGCGAGALAAEAARRGAEVVAVDLSPTMIGVARERAPAISGPGRLEFRAGDMTDPALGRFDHVVAMDSFIHYSPEIAVEKLSGLAERTRGGLLFTFAPRTPLLAAMHLAGQLFPRGDRAPAIVPVAEARMRRALEAAPALGAWRVGRTTRVDSAFYKSQAMELTAA